MTDQQKRLAAAHIRAAMASLEALWAALGLDEELAAEPCEHPQESRKFTAMGQPWTCQRCGARGTN